MKKLVALLVVMMVAAPSMAAVSVSCADAGSGTFTISYAYTDDGGAFPRAFALDVTTDAGTISGVTAAKVGESTSASKGFGIFPGTIVIDSAGNVTNNGTPVAPSTDPGALGGLGTAGVTLELGSLYTTGGKPDNSGTLVTVALAGVTSSANISIAANTTRGGIVLEDATSAGSTSGCVVSVAVPVCKGDVNLSLQVTTGDILPLINLLNTYGGKSKIIGSTHPNFSPEGDVNLDGQNTTGDILPLINMLNTYGGKSKIINCPHPY